MHVSGATVNVHKKGNYAHISTP